MGQSKWIRVRSSPRQSIRWEACIEVSDEILLTTSQDILFSIAEDQGPETHIALGYAGWSPGQLEEELAKNSWLTIPADSDIIFNSI